jgi:hypothetical protein
MYVRMSFYVYEVWLTALCICKYVCIYVILRIRGVINCFVAYRRLYFFLEANLCDVFLTDLNTAYSMIMVLHCVQDTEHNLLPFAETNLNKHLII